ncbi:thiosulfate sulfurtransferase [Centipeda periodontii DSM 2778]|uniref:Thiosulfate sulfurtransferase n=1 Tax=Centipeda periodontii DSM 2778 TaxID=888060 RepID=F5RJ02_9FIRM|nr:thiosulfate sulfurtransferase [Centipeda periodontii DSM 2778]
MKLKNFMQQPFSFLFPAAAWEALENPSASGSLPCPAEKAVLNCNYSTKGDFSAA